VESAFFEWLIQGAVGPASVSLPVNWLAAQLSNAAKGWFRRLRRADDLSRLVKAATPTSIALTQAEFDALRQLLSDQKTWILVGHGTVDNLGHRIADCLPPREGRSEADSQAAALSIARGLLEFAAADLEPKIFQQVVLARLQRLETDQASALDEAMFGLHADIIARFTDAMGELKRALDRLPPGPAQRGEIAVYLNTLIDWLNTDPWPRDRRFDGPILTPAAIERKLRVIVTDREPEPELDADALAQQCKRLVILGGPGTGKTWLAKRTARRCAEEAIAALATGSTPDEIELPLYTTCSRLFSAHGDVREAAVSSALDQLADLGGSRLSAAVRVLFTERNTRTLLVIDSLDEAHGSDERLRQADTLPWRIVLTSRHRSWNRQLVIEENESHRVGELQPLRYPDDVEPFIQRWFQGRPKWGRDLAAQIARRPSLQQSATVPLILAFYCILGGETPLPDLRRDLYAKVLRRMLTGRWRNSDDSQPDVDSCLQTLQAWAWSGATSDQVTGIGTWADDIATSQGQLSQADKEALDHIATPVGPPDIDTGMTFRRFIHRSISEHLVAEYVAHLPVDNAAGALIPHTWYDTDWEYSAPAALAMHPQRDQLLQKLICQAAKSDQIPDDISVVDAGWEFRRFLARAASASSEADWSPELAAMIGRARVELAWSALTGDLAEAAHWATSNRQIREILLADLAGWDANELGLEEAERLVGWVVQLAVTSEDKRQAREKLLELMIYETDDFMAEEMMNGVLQLAPTAEDKRQARDKLLELVGMIEAWTQGWIVVQLVDALVRLDPTTKDKRQARDKLLELLASQTEGPPAIQLVDVLVRLEPTTEDKRQARDKLLMIYETGDFMAEEMMNGVLQLAPTAEDKRQARDKLLELLASQTEGRAAIQLVDTLVRFDPTAEDKRQARDMLLELLASQDNRSAGAEMAEEVIRLDPTAEDKYQARDMLLELLASQDNRSAGAEMAEEVIRLDPTAEDKRQAREKLLELLASQTEGQAAIQLVDALIRLDPTAGDKRQAREKLLELLANQDNWAVGVELTGSLALLEPTIRDLNNWHNWSGRPTDVLLAAVRRNSALAAWLTALPSLAQLSS
jgi:tetratricopeptide (TPR) repeat protein